MEWRADIIGIVHWVLVVIHTLLPAAVGFVVARRVLTDRRPFGLGMFVGAVVTGMLIALGLCLIYAGAVSGRLIASQVALAGYFAVSLLLVLRGFDYLVRRALVRLLPVKRWWGGAAAAGLRVVAVSTVVLPYAMAAVMTYRPRVAPIDTPLAMMGWRYEDVSFPATDGLSIAAWWIPAASGAATYADRTVIVVHGLGASKANQLVLAQELVPRGYNVLAIDLRAHGLSGGQLTTFGDRERRDVLGAVRWVRENKPAQSRRIFGVGASMGAAALIAAMAEPTPDARAIDAVAVYGTYANMGGLIDDVGKTYFTPALRALVRHVAVPIASGFSGTDIAGFRPVDLAYRVWPRPVMVIHGESDSIIPVNQGLLLFRGATQPKRFLFLGGAGHNDIVADPATAKDVADFFESARPIPVI